MLSHILRRGTCVLSAVLSFSPVLVFAQFQQPTDEELKMTADPKAPGAAAVYLNIKEIANDPLHYQSTYMRIKVLTEKGKELATIELPYEKGPFKITDIKGRTIHPDGTVIPLKVKPEDLVASKSGETQIDKKVFTLPDVEVGSILEYSYEVRYDDNLFSSPLWRIQRPYYVHEAHYQFTPFKEFMPTGTPDTSTNMYLTDHRGHTMNSLIWWYKLPPGVEIKTSVSGSYSVDVTDIPPTPDEEWMPPIHNFLYRVFFYYSYAHDAAAFWIEESKQWSKDVDHFAEPTSKIKSAVAGLVTASDGNLDKAKKLYAAVEELDNTDYSRKKSASEMKQLKLKAAKRAEETWEQKSGTSDDIALLYLAMLRAAGLPAYAFKVVDRDQGVFDPGFMDFDQLDSTLVMLNLDGKQFILDPGEKMCPFGTLNWRHSGVRGIGQSSQGVVMVVTPEQRYTDNSINRGGTFTLDAHGGITGQFQIAMTGQEALRWRQVALRNDGDELKKSFDRELERIVPEGVEAHVDHFLGMDDREAMLLAIVKVKGTLGTATAKRLLLPGFFLESRGRKPFVDEEKRQEPVDMHYGDVTVDDLTFMLPEGMAVEASPQPTQITWQGHALLIVKTKSLPGEIVIANSVAHAFTVAKPEEYADLRGFYQKVAAVEQQQLVLTTAQTTQPAATTPSAQSAPVGIVK